MRTPPVGAGHIGLSDLDAWLDVDGGLAVVRLTSAERAHAMELAASLGRGEASCIAAASARGGVFASDDRAARRAAAVAGLPLTGTIGLLLAAARDGAVDRPGAERLHAEMCSAGFRSPVQTLAGLLPDGPSSLETITAQID